MLIERSADGFYNPKAQNSPNKLIPYGLPGQKALKNMSPWSLKVKISVVALSGLRLGGGCKTNAQSPNTGPLDFLPGTDALTRTLRVHSPYIVERRVSILGIAILIWGSMLQNST